MIHYETRYRGAAKKYIDNPPEDMTSEDIRHMSKDELLDMDYFLNEDDIWYTIFYSKTVYSSCPLFAGIFQFKGAP